MLALIIQFRKILSLLLAILISAWLISRSLDQRLAMAHGLQVTVLAPAQFIINKVNKIKNIFHANKILSERNTGLKAENDILQEVRRENQVLRRMLDYREKGRFSLIPAEVIAQKQATTARNIIVGAGILVGVKKDMPVISIEGVVGKIIEAYPFHANVQLINDPFARTGVSINRLNVPGILECRTHKAPAVRVFLHHEIQKGDTIVTSGLGGIFPKGLYVGSIVNILPGDDLFKIAEIELNPGLQNIENTFIMNIKTQWQPFPEEQKK